MASADILSENELTKLRVADLREELKKHGQKPKGRKKELQQQLREYYATLQEASEESQAAEEENPAEEEKPAEDEQPEEEEQPVEEAKPAEIEASAEPEPAAESESEPKPEAESEPKPAAESEPVAEAEPLVEAAEEKPVAEEAPPLKRAWTHTAKDGMVTIPRLRKRTDSEYVENTTAETNEETNEATTSSAEQITPMKRAWTHSAKDGLSSSPRLRKRTDSEFGGPENLDLDAEEPAAKRQKTEENTSANAQQIVVPIPGGDAPMEEAQKETKEEEAQEKEEEKEKPVAEAEEAKPVAKEEESVTESVPGAADTTPETEATKEAAEPVKSEGKKPKQNLAQTINKRFLKDLLQEMKEEELREYVHNLVKDDPAVLKNLKDFMSTHNSMCKLFIRGLIPRQTSEDLKQIYGQYGNLTDIRILRDRYTNVSKNMGFLVYSNHKEALKALERPERRLGDRTIYLNLAMKPNNQNARGSAARDNSYSRTPNTRGYNPY